VRSAGLTLVLITFGFAVAVGCDDRSSSVSFYQAPKDSAAPVDSLISGGAPASPAPAAGASLAWTAPAEWKPLPAQQMRVAAYRVSDSEPAVEFTVIPLGPEAGELLANVNRWENQLALPPTPQDKLDSVVKHQDINGLHADIVDLTGSKSQSPQQRMLAAIVQYGGRVWFFKMLGPEPIVSSQKQNFDAFMQSLHPQAEAAQPTTQSLARSSGSPSNMISWKAPDDWRQLPGSQPPRMLAFEIGPADAA
jgi:hypothetical protein